jgi:uncharacterized protein (TIGR02246 family)
MSIRSLFAALLLSGLLVACASTPPAEAEKQIRELEQQQVRAAIGRDRAALERLFAPDFKLVNPSGAIAGKQELLQLLTEGASPYQSAVYQTDTISVYRDVVVTIGLETVVPARGAQAGQPVRRRVTHVWQRQGRQWRLVLRQATVVTP